MKTMKLVLGAALPPPEQIAERLCREREQKEADVESLEGMASLPSLGDLEDFAAWPLVQVGAVCETPLPGAEGEVDAHFERRERLLRALAKRISPPEPDAPSALSLARGGEMPEAASRRFACFLRDEYGKDGAEAATLDALRKRWQASAAAPVRVGPGDALWGDLASELGRHGTPLEVSVTELGRLKEEARSPEVRRWAFSRFFSLGDSDEPFLELCWNHIRSQVRQGRVAEPEPGVPGFLHEMAKAIAPRQREVSLFEVCERHSRAPEGDAKVEASLAITAMVDFSSALFGFAFEPLGEGGSEILFAIHSADGRLSFLQVSLVSGSWHAYASPVCPRPRLARAVVPVGGAGQGLMSLSEALVAAHEVGHALDFLLAPHAFLGGEMVIPFEGIEIFSSLHEWAVLSPAFVEFLSRDAGYGGLREIWEKGVAATREAQLMGLANFDIPRAMGDLIVTRLAHEAPHLTAREVVRAIREETLPFYWGAPPEGMHSYALRAARLGAYLGRQHSYVSAAGFALQATATWATFEAARAGTRSLGRLFAFRGLESSSQELLALTGMDPWDTAGIMSLAR